MSADTPPLPQTRIRERQRDERLFEFYLANDLPWYLADLLARRLRGSVAIEDLLQPSLARLVDPGSIPDMGRAVERIVRALLSSEAIVFAVDHDMDGTASAAVLWQACVGLFGFPPERFAVVTSHRLTEGYGLTEPVVQRILDGDAGLVVSADKGSSDEPRIAMLAAAGRDVIVTDHHQIPVEGPPASAFAVVNPARSDSPYDPLICGAAVAFLTMAKVRTALLAAGWRETLPSLASLLDYVAVATLADCVALLPGCSYANRVFVRKGLALINASMRPCWRVFREDLGDRPVVSEDIAFRLAPAIAAAGRLDWAEAGFRFLISDDAVEAREQWRLLQRENQERKGIEADLRRQAMEAAAHCEGPAIVLHLSQGHSGVHGITASRLCERFGRPAAIFSPKGQGARHSMPEAASDDLLSGSFRGIDGFDVRQALQTVDQEHPGLLRSFGGHQGAAGATLARERFTEFAAAYQRAAALQLQQRDLAPELWSDGDWPSSALTLDTLDLLRRLEPWGKDFPWPALMGVFRVVAAHPVGDGSHLRMQLERDGRRFAAIWFNAQSPPAVGQAGESLVGRDSGFLYELQDNWYRGNRSLQLRVLALHEDLVSDWLD